MYVDCVTALLEINGYAKKFLICIYGLDRPLTGLQHGRDHVLYDKLNITKFVGKAATPLRLFTFRKGKGCAMVRVHQIPQIYRNNTHALHPYVFTWKIRVWSCKQFLGYISVWVNLCQLVFSTCRDSGFIR